MELCKFKQPSDQISTAMLNGHCKPKLKWKAAYTQKL